MVGARLRQRRHRVMLLGSGATAFADPQQKPIGAIVRLASRLPALEIEQRATQRAFDARLVARQLREVVALRRKPRVHRLYIIGHRWAAWRPGLSRVAEHAGLDPVDAAQAPRADYGALGKLRLHRALRPQHAHQLPVKLPESSRSVARARCAGWCLAASICMFVVTRISGRTVLHEVDVKSSAGEQSRHEQSQWANEHLLSFPSSPFSTTMAWRARVGRAPATGCVCGARSSAQGAKGAQEGSIGRKHRPGARQNSPNAAEWRAGLRPVAGRPCNREATCLIVRR
jgi:hypothetical protein